MQRQAGRPPRWRRVYSAADNEEYIDAGVADGHTNGSLESELDARDGTRLEARQLRGDIELTKLPLTLTEVVAPRLFLDGSPTVPSFSPDAGNLARAQGGGCVAKRWRGVRKMWRRAIRKPLAGLTIPGAASHLAVCRLQGR
jgi:hypothetical protein